MESNRSVDPFDELFIASPEEFTDDNLRDLFKNNTELYQDLDFANDGSIIDALDDSVFDSEYTDPILPYNPDNPSEIVIFIGGHGTEYYGPESYQDQSHKLPSLELMKQQNIDVAIMNKTNIPLVSGLAIGYADLKTDQLLYHNAMSQFDIERPIEESLDKMGKRLIQDYREVLESIASTPDNQGNAKFKKIAELNLNYLKGQKKLKLIKPEYEKRFNVRPYDMSTDSGIIFYGIHVIGAKNVLPEYADYFRKGKMITPTIYPGEDDNFVTKPYEDLISAYEKRHMLGLDPGDEIYEFHKSILDTMVSFLNPYEYDMWLSNLIYALYGFGFTRIFIVDATCRNSIETNLNYNRDPRLHISPIDTNDNSVIEKKWDKMNRALRNVRRSEWTREYLLSSPNTKSIPVKIKQPEGIYKRTRSAISKKKRREKISRQSKKMIGDYIKRSRSLKNTGYKSRGKKSVRKMSR